MPLRSKIPIYKDCCGNARKKNTRLDSATHSLRPKNSLQWYYIFRVARQKRNLHAASSAIANKNAAHLKALSLLLLVYLFSLLLFAFNFSLNISQSIRKLSIAKMAFNIILHGNKRGWKWKRSNRQKKLPNAFKFGAMGGAGIKAKWGERFHNSANEIEYFARARERDERERERKRRESSRRKTERQEAK